MTARSTLYRCHFFTFGGPQTAGIESRWTLDLEPIGETEMFTGEQVELYARVDGAQTTLTSDAVVRFDILEEDFLLTGGLDDRVVSLLGTGASVEDADFPTAEKTTVFVDMAPGETPRETLAEYRRTHADYADTILILAEPAAEEDDAAAEDAATAAAYHVVAWWTAEALEDDANAEMYFIVTLDGSDDKSEETLDVSHEQAPEINTPSMPWTLTSSLRRIHTLIDTGVFDWSVNADEVHAALRVLMVLPPELMLDVVTVMKFDDTWNTLAAALDKYDSPAFTALQQTLDPNARFLVAGDAVRVKVSAAGSAEDKESGTYSVRVEGVRLPLLGYVPVAGLLPEAAATAIARAYLTFLKEPSVELAVVRRRHASIDSQPPNGLVTFDSQPILTDPSDPAVVRDRKQSEYNAYVAPLRDRDTLTLNALGQYFDWLGTHRSDPEFLTRAPADLWAWALAQASAPPREAPVTKFLELYHSLTIGLDRLSPDERTDRSEAAAGFIAWVDAHQDDDAALAKADPAVLWGEIEGRVRVDRIKARIAHDQATAQPTIDWDAVGRKLDEALAFTARVRQVPEPRTIELPDEEIGYLIMASDTERDTRNAIADAFLDDVMAKLGSDTLRDQILSRSIASEFDAWFDAHEELRYMLALAQAYPNSEKYDCPIELEAWQTAVEVGIGFVPVVGNVVVAAEAISGRSLFGRKLSTVERGICAAAILLPFAAKVFKGGKALVSATRLAKDYNLSVKEANALYRAAIPVKPGSVGEKVLSKLFSDIESGRPIRDRESIEAAEQVMREMGMFERTTVQALGVADAAPLAGAELATIAECEELLAKILGDGTIAAREFEALSAAAKDALRAAVRREPQLLRGAIQAESEGGLQRYGDEVIARLTRSGMPGEQAGALRKVIDALSLQRRRGVADGLALAVAEGTDTILAKRLAEVADPKLLRQEGKLWMETLTQRAAKHAANGNAERARRINREVRRISEWLGKEGTQASETKLTLEGQRLADAIKGTEFANRAREGAGNTLQYLWLRFRIYKQVRFSKNLPARFLDYIEPGSHCFLGNYGEFEVAFRLGRTHILLKAPDGIVTLPGTDLVAIPRAGGPTLLIDNKALSSEEVSAVSALTRNLAGNFLDDLDDFAKLAGAGEVPDAVRITIERMIRARDALQAAGLLNLSKSAMRSEATQAQIAAILKQNDIVLVVTNAGGAVKDLSAELKAIGLELLDLNAMPELAP